MYLRKGKLVRQQELFPLIVIIVIVEKDAFGGSVEVLVLPAAQRPQEAAQRCRAEQERQGNEEDEAAHSAGTTAPDATARLRSGTGTALPALRRSAFTTTSTDDNDMASAAISGVT